MRSLESGRDPIKSTGNANWRGFGDRVLKGDGHGRMSGSESVKAVDFALFENLHDIHCFKPFKIGALAFQQPSV